MIPSTEPALESSTQGSPQDLPQKPPWKPWVSGVFGFLFGPVSAAIVTFINLRRLGAPRDANLILALTLVGSVLLGVIPYVMPQDSEWVSRLVGHGVSPFLYPALQKRRFDARVAQAPWSWQSGWRATGWGVLGLPIFLALILLGSLPFELTGSVRDIEVAVQIRATPVIGEELGIEIRVSNLASTAQLLNSIDLDLDGWSALEIVRTEPPSSKFELFGARSYYFEAPVPSGGEILVVLHAIPREAGDFRSDFGVCFDSGLNCADYAIEFPIEEIHREGR